MLIVDSQIHLWQNGKMSAQHRQIPTYAVDARWPRWPRPGLDGAVIHPPSSLGEAVNVLAVEAARLHPDKFCILGHFDLESPDRENIVAHWPERPGMVGFRFPSTSRSRRPGGPMARSTGSGRRARGRDCPSGWADVILNDEWLVDLIVDQMYVSVRSVRSHPGDARWMQIGHARRPHDQRRCQVPEFMTHRFPASRLHGTDGLRLSRMEND